jgi:hypothetical protein
MKCDWSSKTGCKYHAEAAEVWRNTCPSCNKFRVAYVCSEHAKELTRKLQRRAFCANCGQYHFGSVFWQKVGDA